MPAFVYVLRCGDGSLYCGWTTDVQRRLRAHRSGRGSRYVAQRLPAELVLVQPMGDRSAALREEARIKRLTRAQKLELVASGAETDRCPDMRGPRPSSRCGGTHPA